MTKSQDTMTRSLVGITVGAFVLGPLGSVIGGVIGNHFDNRVNNKRRDENNKNEYAKQLLKDGYTTDEVVELLKQW